MKADPDAKRFLRYQSVIDVLRTNSFHKHDIYKSFQTEKPYFIGRVIKELMKDGYLIASEGERSSRLSLQYRVIYAVEQDIVTVFVLEITPHNY
jgi:mRNA-degrading endonuclease RelE of RelBE toxin-antitoxin system